MEIIVLGFTIIGFVAGYVVGKNRKDIKEDVGDVVDTAKSEASTILGKIKSWLDK